mmetsp:Transcript_78024/g.252275  ORF Transcript_78024/g.252275 Transcript_78024/m.252275 type:complete len:127 (+) Transcript_78024:1-381(+)
MVDDVLVAAVVFVEFDADVVVDVDVVEDEAVLVDVVVVVRVLVDVVVFFRVLVDVVVELLVEVDVEMVVDVAVLVVVSVVVGSCKMTWSPTIIKTPELTSESPEKPAKNKSNRAEAISFVRTSVFT